MSLRSRIEKPPPFHALPRWRKGVLVAGLAFTVVVGAMTVDKQFDVYSGAPDHPVAATGNIYAVHVNHGSLRYATKEQRDSLFFWEVRMGSWIGVPFLAMVFLWLLYQPRKDKAPA
jgi:hypothetical protein